MREENQIKKIEYFTDTLNGIDADLISLLKERLSISEELSEYVLKNNLETDSRVNRMMNSSDLAVGEKELANIFDEIKKLEQERYKKTSRSFHSKYAHIAGKESDLLIFLFKDFVESYVNSFDLNEEEISNLLDRKNFIGYFIEGKNKSKVLDYVTDMTDQVKEIGEANLVQKYKNKNFAFNTEFFGFLKMVQRYDLDFADKQVLIIEEDNSNSYLDFALKKLNVSSILHLNIKDYEPYQIQQESIVINTVNFEDLKKFEKLNFDNFDNLELVIDLSSVQFNTRLMIDARDHGAKAINSIYKLIFQYKKSFEILFRRKFSDEDFEDLLQDYIYHKMNIVLVGMPGAGKTTIGRKLGKLLNRKHIDLDREFYYEYGISPQEYLRTHDERSFREKERIVVEKIGRLKGVVLSTSGGVVSRLENYYHLKKNSVIFMVERELSNLSTKNRPLSQGGIETLIKMKEERSDNYRYFTDYTVENRGDFNGVAYEILNIFEEEDFTKF